MLAATLALVPFAALAGTQAEESLAPSVASLMSRAVSDRPVPGDYASRAEYPPAVDAALQRDECAQG
jgi:hypothetical protein